MSRTTRVLALVTALVGGVAAGGVGCEGDALDVQKLRSMATSRVTTELTYFKDTYGRYVQLNGVNVGGSTKVPYNFSPLTYVGRPFPLKDADAHFARIRALGFNSIRLLWIWEAVEPNARGEYDTAYLDYFEQLITKAEEHGIYVLINMHDNLYSRHLFTRYNESTDAFYFSYCRSTATQIADFSTRCTDQSDCGSGATCTKPTKAERNVLIDSLLAAFPQPNSAGAKAPDDFFSDRVTGDGAPLWAVKACLPEKNLDSPRWGVFKSVGLITENLEQVLGALGGLTGGASGTATGPEIDVPAVTSAMLTAKAAGILPESMAEGTDMMPWTFWGINTLTSTDVQRCGAVLYAGNKVFPSFKQKLPDGTEMSTQDYLQSAVAGCWGEIAKRAVGHENVIGYDLINEPLGAFVGLLAYKALASGASGAVTSLLSSLAGPEMGATISGVLNATAILPPIPTAPAAPIEPKEPMRLPDETDAAFAARKDAYTTQKADYDTVLYPEYQQRQRAWTAERDRVTAEWGFDKMDLLSLAGTLLGFDKNHLQPFFERISQQIIATDPRATIWVEGSMGVNMLLGEGTSNTGVFEQNMTRPKGVSQVVFAPHWYPDIYPNMGFNQDPRAFTAEEWEYRDFTAALEGKASRGAYSLGNPPVVFGEFGTYWNYNGIDWSIANDYRISEQILDNYYESFEKMNANRMLWCYTADNDKRYGDKWNHEDFSVFAFDGKSRGEQAFNRPFARAVSGKPIATHFYSPLHYYDPDKGQAIPLKEYLLEFASKETDAPTEIHVPDFQYPDGFYVWLGDGYAIYDHADQTLYYYPTADQPGAVHRVVVRPPQVTAPDVRDNQGWRYFFRGDEVVERAGGAR